MHRIPVFKGNHPEPGMVVEAAIPPVIPAAREAGLRRLRCKASWRKV
jgi:hypothetical protein